MTGKIHRFDFGSLRDFRGPIAFNTVDAITVDLPEAPPPPPVFNEQDIDAARIAGKREGYTEGFGAGKLEAQKEADAKAAEVNEALLKLGGIIGGLSGGYKKLIEQETQHLSRLITSVARKVAGEAMDVRGEEVILAIVARCLPVIFNKPKLVIDLNPDVFERALERIETVFRENGIEAEIQFRANPELGISDLHLDWGSGQIDRSADALWQEIESLIERIPLEMTFDDTLHATEQQPEQQNQQE